MTSTFPTTAYEWLAYLYTDAVWPRVVLGVLAYISAGIFTAGFAHATSADHETGVIAGVFWPLTAFLMAIVITCRVVFLLWRKITSARARQTLLDGLVNLPYRAGSGFGKFVFKWTD